jgi:condensin-2 complex subunit D3
LEALIDRSNDKVSTVRAKALSGLSSALSLGLKSVSFSEDGASLEDSEFMGSMLRETLYVASNDIGPRTAEETPLMSRLIELFREGVSDDKTFVRKAAINALEALISARNGSIHSSMAGDLLSIHSRCTDSSVIVRTQAMKSLSSILLKFPSDAEVQKLWNLGVVPLCVDPEASVQACALDLVSKILFERLVLIYVN